MPAAVIYSIDRGCRAGALLPDRVQYRLDDEFLLPVETCDAYCRTCDALRGAELIHDWETEARLFTPEDRIALRGLKPGNLSYDGAYLSMRRFEWRKTRQSPPRCIICGATDVFLLVGQRCTDPVTGHTFEPVEFEMYASIPLSWAILDSEGLILECDFRAFRHLLPDKELSP